MADPMFQSIIDFIYWFFTGMFGLIQEGASKIAEFSGIPQWFLIIIVIILMIILMKQKLSTWMFWGLLLLILMVIAGIAGAIPLEQMLTATPSTALT